jgi:hypothetical protein
MTDNFEQMSEEEFNSLPSQRMKAMKEEISRLKSQLSTAREDTLREVLFEIEHMIYGEDCRKKIQTLFEKEAD